MNRQLNLLVQLQDLIVARSEQETLLPERQLSELNNSIEALKNELPRQLSRRFETLQKHYNVAVVPVVNQACTGCGAVLPTSLNQNVQKGKEIIQCPTCSRILYFYRGPARMEEEVEKKPSAGITRFTSEELMVPSLEAEKKEEAIEECIQLMADKDYIYMPDEVLETALSREAIISTAIGNGLAFPHARGIECCGLTLAICLKKDGIVWRSPDDENVKVVIFMVIPTAASAFYLKVISGLMKTFEDKNNYKALLSCETSEEMWDTLLRVTDKTIL